MAAAASSTKDSKTSNNDTKRYCDVCQEKINTFPMYHCSYCNEYDICSSVVCIRHAELQHVKYSLVPIWSVEELQTVMKHNTPHQAPHAPLPPGGPPPSPLKKPKVPLGPKPGTMVMTATATTTPKTTTTSPLIKSTPKGGGGGEVNTNNNNNNDEFHYDNPFSWNTR
jgi:hypothetical protein